MAEGTDKSQSQQRIDVVANAVAMEGMRKDIKSVEKAVTSLHEELREFKNSFASKDQLSEAKRELSDRIADVEGVQKKDQERTQFYVRAVMVGFITAVIGLIFAYIQLGPR